MSHQAKRPLITLVTILASASFVRAEIVVHELGSTAANTLTHLSKNLVTGCVILAVGIVLAAFISRKK